VPNRLFDQSRRFELSRRCVPNRRRALSRQFDPNRQCGRSRPLAPNHRRGLSHPPAPAVDSSKMDKRVRATPPPQAHGPGDS
jgi:hypothetical protein